MEQFNLNTIPGKVAPVCHASQYDTGRVIRVNLYEGDQVYTLDGTEVVSVSVRKPDGHIVTEGVTNTSAAYVEIVTTEQMTACYGANLCELKIEKGADVLGTLNFILSVEEDPLAGGDPSESFVYNLATQIYNAVADQYDSNNVIFDAAPTPGHGVPYTVTSEGIDAAIPQDLDDLNDVTTTTPASGEALVWDGTKWVNGTPTLDVEDLDNVTITTPSNGDIMVYNNGTWENQANPSSTSNFAPDYDDTATYNTNDKVIYQGLLYVCLEDSVTGAWDGTKWQQISVADLNAELLPIQSGSATNTKDYIDTGLSGKADTSTTYTKTEVDNLLGDKLDSAYLVKTNSGSFAALVKPNTVWLIMVQRVSLNTSCVLLCHNYNNSVITKEIVLDSGMAYVTNSQGTVSITYGGSGESVRGGAYRLY